MINFSLVEIFAIMCFSQSNYGLGTDIIPWGAEFKDFNYQYH